MILYSLLACFAFIAATLLIVLLRKDIDEFILLMRFPIVIKIFIKKFNKRNR